MQNFEQIIMTRNLWNFVMVKGRLNCKRSLLVLQFSEYASFCIMKLKHWNWNWNWNNSKKNCFLWQHSLFAVLIGSTGNSVGGREIIDISLLVVYVKKLPIISAPLSLLEPQLSLPWCTDSLVIESSVAYQTGTCIELGWNISNFE